MASVVAETDANGVTRLVSAGVPTLVQTAADYTVLAGESPIEVTDVSATRAVTLPSARLNPGPPVPVQHRTGTQTATRATAAVLPNTPTYSAGAKTLTAGSNTTLTVDGGVVALNDTVIVKNQATGSQNGPYKCTAAGDGSNPWVLTRDTS